MAQHTQRRTEINEAYKYGQHLAKFGKGMDGKQYDVAGLRELHERIYDHVSKNPQDLVSLRKHFMNEATPP
jgi:hypothetical protein